MKTVDVCLLLIYLSSTWGSIYGQEISVSVNFMMGSSKAILLFLQSG